MSVNYQFEMEKMIKEISGHPKLLLHSCCAPCSTAVIERLAQIFDVDVYYYNPNIEPEEEYLTRLAEQRRLLEQTNFATNVGLICGEYDNMEFLRVVTGMENEPEGGARCASCIRLRMEKTAQAAQKNGYEYFTTTLSVSPHKNAKCINEIGKELADKYGVKYLFSDFKKKDGYRRSIELSNEYSLYRQDYCGCLFAKK